jgi:hypothetical protein
MCRATMTAGRFDPSLCPLLQHLPPEEQQERMRSDPAISRCVRAMGLGKRAAGHNAVVLPAPRRPRARSGKPRDAHA